MNRLIVAITGTPGTGKSELATVLSKKIPGSSILEINDIVNKYKLYSKKNKFGTKIVDLGRLNKKLSVELKRKNGTVIIAGHLAQELRFRCDVAVVTRCGLVKLAERLNKRKYAKEKAAENLVAEATDYCGLKMIGRCRNTYEVETRSEKSRIMSYIVALSKGKAAKKPTKRQIDELGDLIKLVKGGNKYGL